MFGVWVIGNSDLDIVCYLLFGAWDFVINHCAIVVIRSSLNLHTSVTRKCILKIGITISAKIERYVIQISKSS